VVFSLNRHRGPNSKSGAAGQMAIIEDIKATDPYEVTISLKEANVDLPYLMSDYHLIIQPEGDKGDSGIGTGPYVIEKADPGVRYQSKRNPNYFKTDRAWFDSVETLVINDGTARIAALSSGRAHLINNVDPKTVGALKSSPNLKIVNTAGRAFYYFPMFCDRPPFNNPDLRLALKYAIDREQMVKQILFGYGSVGNDNPINKTYPLFSDTIPQTSYDPDKAKFHFQKAGYSGPIVVHTADAAFPGAVDACALFQQSAQNCGIALTIRRDPSDGYWDNVWMKETFCASYWGGRPTQDQMLSIAFKSDATWNDSKWFNPAFDKLLAAARSELDNSKRKQLYHDAVLMVHDDAGHITPMFNDFIAGMSSKMQGYVSDPTLELSGARAMERCWFQA
jgi:peptide/nickel transport system substrate-binding protein